MLMRFRIPISGIVLRVADGGHGQASRLDADTGTRQISSPEVPSPQSQVERASSRRGRGAATSDLGLRTFSDSLSGVGALRIVPNRTLAAQADHTVQSGAQGAVERDRRQAVEASQVGLEDGDLRVP